MKKDDTDHLMENVKHLVLKPQDLTAPNHHIYDNRGVWWCYMTLYFYGGTSDRIRFSLNTREVERARINRDKVFMAIKLAVKRNEERLKNKTK